MSNEDADHDIVVPALQKSTSHDHVIIYGEDVDLLVLLCGLGSTRRNIYFQKSSRGEAGCVQFSASSFNQGTVELPPGFELFIHAFSGCDTTSALFWQGKMKMWGHFRQHQALVDQSRVFLQTDIWIYGDIWRRRNDRHPQRWSLRTFVETAAKANLAGLPPTIEAASYHHYRT